MNLDPTTSSHPKRRFSVEVAGVIPVEVFARTWLGALSRALDLLGGPLELAHPKQLTVTSTSDGTVILFDQLRAFRITIRPQELIDAAEVTHGTTLRSPMKLPPSVPPPEAIQDEAPLRYRTEETTWTVPRTTLGRAFFTATILGTGVALGILGGVLAVVLGF